jgi:hypothetical protein
MRVSPETFRGRALECMRLAQALRASRHRTLLLALAHSWAQLANAAEEFQALVERAARLPQPAFVKTKARRTRASNSARERSTLH